MGRATRSGAANALARLMHRQLQLLHGRAEGKQCGTCSLLVGHGNSKKRTYLKCSLTVFTHGAATDWRMKWEACGRHKETER